VGVLAEHGVGGVDGAAEGGVHRGGVGQREVRGDVADREAGDRAVAALHHQSPVRGAVEHCVGLPVGDPPPPAGAGIACAGEGDGPVVAAGLDEVTGRDLGAIAQLAQRGRIDAAQVDELVADVGAQQRGIGVRRDDQQRVQPGQVIGEIAADRRDMHLLDRAALEPPPVLVLGEHGRIPGTQSCAGRALPRGGEAADLVQPVRAVVDHQQLQQPARADGAELMVVAGEHQFPAPGPDQVGDPGEVGGVGHAGLVHDEQVPRLHPVPDLPVVVGGEGAEEGGDVGRPRSPSAPRTGCPVRGPRWPGPRARPVALRL
jgi:hypothetical protein